MTANRQKWRSDAGEESICEAIVSYLLEHPDAQDTARGIAEWWLPEKGLRCGVRNTEQALQRLVQTGWVSEWCAADGRRHYRLHPERAPRDRVDRLAEDGEDRGGGRGGSSGSATD